MPTRAQKIVEGLNVSGVSKLGFPPLGRLYDAMRSGIIIATVNHGIIDPDERPPSLRRRQLE